MNGCNLCCVSSSIGSKLVNFITARKFSIIYWGLPTRTMKVSCHSFFTNLCLPISYVKSKIISNIDTSTTTTKPPRLHLTKINGAVCSSGNCCSDNRSTSLSVTLCSHSRRFLHSDTIRNTQLTFWLHSKGLTVCGCEDKTLQPLKVLQLHAITDWPNSSADLRLKWGHRSRSYRL